jgi:hypothetical protein
MAIKTKKSTSAATRTSSKAGATVRSASATTARKQGVESQARPAKISQQLLEQRIRERSYEIYTKRAAHGQDGSEAGDWLAAEQSVKKELRLS